jgi:hypothetical protein
MLYKINKLRQLKLRVGGVVFPIIGIKPTIFLQTHFCQCRTLASKIAKYDVRSRRLKNSKPKIFTLERAPKGSIKANFELFVPIFQNLNPYLHADEIRNFIKLTVEAHNWLVINTGIAQATKDWKAITNYCINLLEGRNPKTLFRVSLGRVDGWPKLLTHLRPLFHRIRDSKKLQLSSVEIAETHRFLRTLFKLNRVCYDYIDLDVTGIGETFRVPEDIVKEFEEFLLQKYPEPLLKDPSSLDIIPLSGQANGPNSLPKRETAIAEAYAIVNSHWIHKFTEYCVATENMDFLEYVKHLSSLYSEETNIPLDQIILRKLVAIPDKGNKSRVIAICDIFTQMLLNSLERFVIECTSRNFPNNSAFMSHVEGFNKIKKLPKEIQEELISLDAEAWTDNLPARLQFLNLRAKVGPKLAQAWQSLAVTCDWHIGNSGKTVRYGKGQGMGTKGSFVIAQDTNLEFLEFILLKEYSYKFIPNKCRPFFLEVGDDMVIQDPLNLVGDWFESIGVPINAHKSKYSVGGVSHIEFVSRNLTNGLDTSIISPTLIVRARRQKFLLPTLVSHLNERINNPFNFTSFLREIGIPDKEMHKLCFLSSVYELASSNISIPFTEFDDSINEICMQQFSIAMIYEIGKYYHDNVTNSSFRDLRIGAAKADLLKTQFELNGGDIWTYAISRSLDLNQVEFLYTGSKIRNISSEKHTDGLTYVPSLCIKPNEHGYLYASQELIEILLKMHMSQIQSFVRLKSIARLCGLAERSSTANVHLFKFLNSCLSTYKTGIPDGSEILIYLEYLQLDNTFSGLIKQKCNAPFTHMPISNLVTKLDEVTTLEDTTVSSSIT